MTNASAIQNTLRACGLCGAAVVDTSCADVLIAGEIAIFIKQHRAVFAGRELRLPLKEFRILSALVSRAGEVLTRAELLDKVWGEDVTVDPRNVDVHVRWLRKRLEGDPDGARLIQTVHGVGYRFAG